jgi:hypothetical protein
MLSLSAVVFASVALLRLPTLGDKQVMLTSRSEFDKGREWFEYLVKMGASVVRNVEFVFTFG